MKNETKQLVQIIEESVRYPDNSSSKIKFSIIFKPSQNSSETRVFEKTFIVLDAELASANFDVLSELKIGNAMEVFKDFYKQNFLSKNI